MKLTLRLILVCTLTVGAAYGGDEVPISITRAEVGCEADAGNIVRATSLQLVFNKSIKADEIMPCKSGDKDCRDAQAKLQLWIDHFVYGIRNYTLMTVDGGDRVRLEGLPATDQILDNSATFTIATPTAGYSAFDLSDAYVLLMKNVDPSKGPQFEVGKVPDPNVLNKPIADPNPFMIKVTKNSSCELPPTELPGVEKSKEAKEKAAWEARKLDDLFSEPSRKESPGLKVDFALSGSKKEQALFSFNVGFRPYTTRRLGWGGHTAITWFFVDTEYKINAKKGDKKNVLNIGAFDLNWTRVRHDDSGRARSLFSRKFPAVILSMTPRLETEWGFKEVNGVLEPRVTLPINLYQSRGTTFQLHPFVGLELGRKFRSEIDKPGKLIRRALIGANLTANFFRKGEKPRLAFQVEYIRRVILEPELSYGFDSEGEEIPVRHSRLPREYGKVRFDFTMSELFVPFIQYEYGRVPPKYTLLNHSFKSGIAFNVDMVWKAFK